MKDLLSRLTVLTEVSSVFTDVSNGLDDFGMDTQTITLTNTGSMYIGYSKVVRDVFFLINTPSTGTRSVTVSYYNGSEWTQADSVDDTKGFTRSGHITLDIPDDATKTTVNGSEKFWLKLTVSVSTTATVFQGIGCIFSDDYELKREFPKILDAGFLMSQTTHTMVHEAARNEIVQHFRNKGRYSINGTDIQRLVCWDLSDLQEVRQAATFLALSKIFLSAANSGKEDDNWLAKSRHYASQAKKALDLAWLTWDRNGENTSSTSPVSVVFMRRG